MVLNIRSLSCHRSLDGSCCEGLSLTFVQNVIKLHISDIRVVGVLHKSLVTIGESLVGKVVYCQSFSLTALWGEFEAVFDVIILAVCQVKHRIECGLFGIDIARIESLYHTAHSQSLERFSLAVLNFIVLDDITPVIICGFRLKYACINGIIVICVKFFCFQLRSRAEKDT